MEETMWGYYQKRIDLVDKILKKSDGVDLSKEDLPNLTKEELLKLVNDGLLDLTQEELNLLHELNAVFVTQLNRQNGSVLYDFELKSLLDDYTDPKLIEDSGDAE